MGPAPVGCGCGTHLVTLGFYGYPNLMLFPTCEFIRSCHIKAETRIIGAPSRFPLVAALTCSGAVLHKSQPFRNIWPLHVSPFQLCIALCCCCHCIHVCHSTQFRVYPATAAVGVPSNAPQPQLCVFRPTHCTQPSRGCFSTGICGKKCRLLCTLQSGNPSSLPELVLCAGSYSNAFSGE